MSRLPLLSAEDLTEAERRILSRPINLHRLLAHSPQIGQAFVDLGMAIRHTGALDGRLRELAILQVGYAARSQYEVSHHVKLGMDAGLSREDIRAIAEDHDGHPGHHLGHRERLVLAAAREMDRDLRIGDDTWAALERELGPRALLELGVTIAFYAAVVRVLATFEVDVEPDWAEHLAVLPLAGGAE